MRLIMALGACVVQQKLIIILEYIYLVKYFHDTGASGGRPRQRRSRYSDRQLRKVVSSKPDFATNLLAHAMIWLLPKRLKIQAHSFFQRSALRQRAEKALDSFPDARNITVPIIVCETEATVSTASLTSREISWIVAVAFLFIVWVRSDLIFGWPPTSARQILPS